MKKRSSGSSGVDESWLLTYSDSITLLMAFFVLLLSVSSIDQAKVEQMSSGISDVFSKTESEQPFSSMQEKLNDVVAEQQLQDKISITPDALGLHLRFSSQVLFTVGSAQIKPDMVPVLAVVAQAIKDSGYTQYLVKVEGHTDNQPISRSKLYESNWELSAHRATNVVKKLVQAGIAQQDLLAIAMADSFPLVPNFNRDGTYNRANQAKNRRIEVYIHRKFE